MGLRDFFYNIINKFKKNELKQLPAPQTIINNNDEVYEPEVEKNAYVNAYTNKINTKKSELKINEDGTRIKFIDSKTNKQIEVQRITKIKEKLEFNETNIDLYKAIYAIGSKEDRKLKKVYFALPTEKGILDLYKGSSKKASLKKKLKLMFSPSNLENKKVFLGVIIEDEIYNDETNEHVDNVCAFTAPGEVVLAWTDDENDPQYEMSKACLSVLENVTDAKGRHIKVRKMLIPKKPVCITEEELNGFEFEEGEDMREAGERLAASYVNFYIANDSVIVPQFDDEADSLAINVLKEAFPDRKIVGIYARDIIVGGGNIHCITQQIPEVK